MGAYARATHTHPRHGLLVPAMVQELETAARKMVFVFTFPGAGNQRNNSISGRDEVKKAGS